MEQTLNLTTKHQYVHSMQQIKYNRSIVTKQTNYEVFTSHRFQPYVQEFRNIDSAFLF